MMSVDAARPRKIWSSPSPSNSSETSPCACLPAVTPAGDELAEFGRDPRDPLDRLEDRADRAVADRGALDQHPVGAADRDGGLRDHARAGLRVQRFEFPARDHVED
jgi:hypothetical protein